MQKSAWKPKIQVKEDAGAECPYCHASIKSGYAICPSCGRSLTPDKCSFCGAPKKITAKFCTRCGQSSEGVVCPQCGTLNSRNFCRKCNTPLTAMAQRALADTQNDPAFKAVQKKADELAELHARIEALRNSSAEQSPLELSEEDKALLKEYADILDMIGTTQIHTHQKEDTETKSEALPKRKQYSAETVSIDDLLKAYKEKAAEMNDALASMTPPPDFTPEQQRDYFSARKIATVVTETACDMSGYRPTQWRCNFCNNLHDNPSECARPELGGVWEYVSAEEYIAENTRVISTSLNIQ